VTSESTDDQISDARAIASGLGGSVGLFACFMFIYDLLSTPGVLWGLDAGPIMLTTARAYVLLSGVLVLFVSAVTIVYLWQS